MRIVYNWIKSNWVILLLLKILWTVLGIIVINLLSQNATSSVSNTIRKEYIPYCEKSEVERKKILDSLKLINVKTR